MGPNNHARIPIEVRDFDLLPDVALVRQPTVQALFGVSHSTLWRRVRSGALPQPVKVGAATRWRVGELRVCLAGLSSAAAA
jgi:predicted DNA-binding transcriptional regulator AlpA